MTNRFLRFAAASAKQFKFTPTARPYCLPANLSPTRFVWEGRVKGFGLPGISGSVFTSGLTVWDWNAANNEFELINFGSSSSGDYNNDFSSRSNSGPSGMVSANDLIVAQNSVQESGIDTKAYRAKMSIASSPNSAITFVQASTYAYDEPFNSHSPYYAPPATYNGALIFGMNRDGNAGSDWGSVNGYVQKVAVASAVYGGPFRSGLASNSLQYTVGKQAVGLGGATPNGYVVLNVSDQTGTTITHQLINCTGTPTAVGAAVTYSGYVFGSGVDLCPFGANTVLAMDLGSPVTYASKVVLLYTNSPTTPTTLAAGASAVTPAPLDFPLADLEYAYVQFGSQAVNLWIKEGRMLAWAIWKRKAASGDGAWYRPVILSSTGTGNLTITVPTSDMTGKPCPVVTQNPGYGPISPSYIVSAPGGKAVLFTQNTDAAGGVNQYIFQF